MSDTFRDLLRKVASGTHTSEDLTRSEAEAATRMILTQEATPAQIGAFMISHRIKRPTGEELAGMLDAYDQFGSKLQPIEAPYRPIVMSLPYDGRSRTMPLSPLTALVLAAAEVPIVLHGGGRIPTKYGIPLTEVWQTLGIDWTHLDFEQAQQIFAQTKIGFVYQPRHFPLAEGLVEFRDQIGKRPPFATLELFWCPYAGDCLLVSGFVHPPTEGMASEAFSLRGTGNYITVKGLEGSCDLPRDRTCIIGLGHKPGEPIERLLLHPRDYGFAGTDVPLEEAAIANQMQAVLQNEGGDLQSSIVWNSGFYLWRSDVCTDMESGLSLAKDLIASGQVAQKLSDLHRSIAQLQPVALR
ncbi:MAG: anthranilate phosphoribosyltransferase family protein [Leptolyngbyaceae cyanobacterium SM1_3_5]|nr:anthranilate phosphoribosyltransferase family protein [Leptolyngbyaceae cyanobacterium SM1_3_5]